MSNPKQFQKTRLSLIAGALLFMAATGAAQADSFTKKEASADVKLLENRLEEVEQQLRSIATQVAEGKVNKVEPSATGGTPTALPGGTGDPKRILDVDMFAEQPYQVLGKVNGMNLVRIGDRRQLLSDKELETFELVELKRAQRFNNLGSPVAASVEAAVEKLTKLPEPPKPPVVAAPPTATPKPVTNRPRSTNK